MKTFSLYFTFDDLKRNGERLHAQEYIKYTGGDVHSGSTFPGTIIMNEDAAAEFERMCANGLQVVFWTYGYDEFDEFGDVGGR